MNREGAGWAGFSNENDDGLDDGALTGWVLAGHNVRNGADIAIVCPIAYDLISSRLLKEVTLANARIRFRLKV